MLRLVHGGPVDVDGLRGARQAKVRSPRIPESHDDIVALVTEESSGDIALLETYGVCIWQDREVSR